MEENIVKGRHFREQIAAELCKNFSYVADDYRAGLTAKKIKLKYNLVSKLGIEVDGQNVDTSILMALGGYTNLNGFWIPGLIPQNEYSKLATINQITKGMSIGERQIIGRESNNYRLEKKGIEPYSDDERYLIWLGMYSDDLKDSRGRVRRKELTQAINDEIYSGKTVRNDTQVRNIMTQFTTLKNKK